MYFDRYDYLGNSFEQTYRCYSTNFIDKPQLEGGDKIIMPPSALDRLASLDIEYPMLFELRNALTERVSHCGVLEFIAEEGMVYMPYWIMQNLLLQEGDIVQIKNATLPKGTYVHLQPHTSDFSEISNTKAMLETNLRNYSCLTMGDNIMIPYNNKKYYIDILETKPSSAIGITDIDFAVDIALPLDYKKPERTKPFVPSNKAQVQDARPEAVAGLKFNPFSGSARRLDGKPSTHAPGISNVDNCGHSEATNGSMSSMSTSLSSVSLKTSGKLVLGSSAGHASKEAQKVPKEEPPKNEEPKFQAFTGKKFSLKD